MKRVRNSSNPAERIDGFDVLSADMRAALRQDEDARDTIARMMLAGRHADARQYLDRLVAQDHADYARQPRKSRRI